MLLWNHLKHRLVRLLLTNEIDLQALVDLLIVHNNLLGLNLWGERLNIFGLSLPGHIDSFVIEIPEYFAFPLHGRIHQLLIGLS